MEKKFNGMTVREYYEKRKNGTNSEEEDRGFRKAMIEEYPFLEIRNVWTDEKVEDPYEFTWFDDLEPGWAMTFGIDLLDELKEELIKADYLDKYRICQIKSKFGTLRWYDNGCTEKWMREILPKYEDLSETTCCICGKPTTKVEKGWITYMCDECAQKSVDRRNDFCIKHGEEPNYTMEELFYDYNPNKGGTL